MQVVYCAAHGGFARERVALGGGAAVFEHLVSEWSRTHPFTLHTVTPAILESRAPSGRDLIRFGERQYAAFCNEFERATTKEVLRHNPSETAVLVNDISEGPDFAKLATAGFRLFTIYHVDVVAYITNIHLRGAIRPETTVRWHRRLRPFLPAMARLVWDKQEASVRHSTGLILPSEEMREMLLRCYPECSPQKIHILPWGVFESDEAGQERLAPGALREELGIPADGRVLLTLSRISPEKGLDLLLDALIEWEGRPDYPRYPLWLVICGEAAYMQGQGFFERLKILAAKLKRTRVAFPGYVTGVKKRAMFEMADLYVFPSRHESYGLTLLEALAAGLPAVCLDHHGARSVMSGEFGRIVGPRDLRAAIAEILGMDEDARRNMGAAARSFAATQRFSESAARIAKLLAAE
jgi:glycosyltransferase involved in cell wall biosynthesis